MQRLQDSKSTYDVVKWQEERLKQVKLVGMRTKYDYAIMSKKDLHGLSSDASVLSLSKNAAISNSVRKS